jgi:hypothetical protein
MSRQHPTGRSLLFALEHRSSMPQAMVGATRRVARPSPLECGSRATAVSSPQPCGGFPRRQHGWRTPKVGALVQAMVNRSSGPMFSRGLPPVQRLLKNGRLPSLCHSITLRLQHTRKPGHNAGLLGIAVLFHRCVDEARLCCDVLSFRTGRFML